MDWIGMEWIGLDWIGLDLKYDALQHYSIGSSTMSYKCDIVGNSSCEIRTLLLNFYCALLDISYHTDF